MKLILKLLFHLLVVLLLTLLTQVGGVVWLITILVFNKTKFKRRWFIPSFLTFYLACTFLIVPLVASVDGRVPLPVSKSGKIAPHNLITVILNRHYVKEELLKELNVISKEFTKTHSSTKLIYLDANFPFIDGFTLLPHRSHNDGRKIDLAFIYTKSNNITNSKPSRSGYGFFEEPRKGEYNQPKACLLNDYWQYDFTKHLTLGSSSKYKFDENSTKDLLLIILNRAKTHKVFIEPHLKTRLKIDHAKCRYHGCKAVRHDDHIHYQI